MSNITEIVNLVEDKLQKLLKDYNFLKAFEAYLQLN